MKAINPLITAAAGWAAIVVALAGCRTQQGRTLSSFAIESPPATAAEPKAGSPMAPPYVDRADHPTRDPNGGKIMSGIVEERVLELYVNSKLHEGAYTQGPSGGRWVKTEIVPIPDGAGYYDHSTEITAKNPPSDPSQWGHEVAFERRHSDGKILAVRMTIWCENHPIFGAGRWYGVRLRLKMRFIANRGIVPEKTESKIINQ